MDTPFLGMILPWPMSWAPAGWALCQGQELQVSQNNALFSLLGYTYGGNGTTTFKLPDFRGRLPMGAGIRTGSNVTYTMGLTGGNDMTAVPANSLPVHSHTLNAASVTVDFSKAVAATTVTNVQTSATVSYGVPATTDTAQTMVQVPGSTLVLGPVKTKTGTEIDAYCQPSTDASKNITLKPVDITVSTTGGSATATTTISGTQAVAISGTTANAGSGSPFDARPPFLAVNYIIALEGLYPVRD